MLVVVDLLLTGAWFKVVVESDEVSADEACWRMLESVGQWL